ncbi:hypothetical protein ABPG74_007213 [Tetrahymena malaccensis]
MGYLSGQWNTNYFIQWSSSIIILMSLSSIIILKRNFHRQHFLGLLISFNAMFLIGFKSLGEEIYVLQIFFLILAKILFTIQLTYEEQLFRKYKLNPAQLAGYEGIFGIVFASIGVIISNNISCQDSFCNYDNDGQGYLDNFSQFFSNTFISAGNFFLVFVHILLTTFLSYVAYLIIKKISAITFVLSQSNSQFLNNIMLMIANLMDFQWYYIIYYILSVKGTLVFCEIIRYPCFGFNRNRGHGIGHPQILAYQQQYDQNYNNLIYPQQNFNEGNNIVVLIQNKEIDNQLHQPLLQEISSEPNYQQPRPSNNQNQIGIIIEEQKGQPQQQQFQPSNVLNQNNQYPNQQQRINQNLVNQPQNQQLLYQDFATIKQILKDIKSIQFEKLAQIKQIIALIEDVDKKIPLQEHSLRLKIAKILQQMANKLTKNYSNTIKMKMAKLIQEDQYSDVTKINEMRYIQDRMYYLVNNNNITANCIKEIINWIERDLQPDELEKASQNLQQINDQFLNEQDRDQQYSDSNWGENYQAIQQKIKLI